MYSSALNMRSVFLVLVRKTFTIYHFFDR